MLYYGRVHWLYSIYFGGCSCMCAIMLFFGQYWVKHRRKPFGYSVPFCLTQLLQLLVMTAIVELICYCSNKMCKKKLTWNNLQGWRDFCQINGTFLPSDPNSWPENWLSQNFSPVRGQFASQRSPIGLSKSNFFYVNIAWNRLQDVLKQEIGVPWVAELRSFLNVWGRYL